ncbi:MAG: polysaccharide deacetylase family protein [Rhizobiaceae bacterium]|nr:polysaccharide deacetylase family protein [Rhizobiaceae bacterium]
MNEPTEIWEPLREVLREARRQGHGVQFWLRDDDAVEPTPALDRLLNLCDEWRVPLVLAVIPQPTGNALADRLAAFNTVSVAVHGWAHLNHALPGEKKQELGRHRPASTIIGELREGLEKLKGLYGSRAIPMLVPPWNRIDPDLVPRLKDAGFTTLSTYGPKKMRDVQVMNSTVDVIDWHGTRGCVDHARLVGQIVQQVRSGETIGILTHHLVHDEAVWLFLQRLFDTTRAYNVEWLSSEKLLKSPE